MKLCDKKLLLFCSNCDSINSVNITLLSIVLKHLHDKMKQFSKGGETFSETNETFSETNVTIFSANETIYTMRCESFQSCEQELQELQEL